MIFEGGICLFGCLSLGLGLGPILRIYHERFHLPNRHVIKFS